MKKTLTFILSCFLIFALVGIAHVYHTQEDKLFQRTKLPDDYQFTYTAPFEEVFLHTEDGATLNALYFTTPNPKGVVLYFRGRGGNLSNNWDRISNEFTERGYDFFIMDYRGVGKSRGKLSEKALCSDAEECYDYLLHFFPEDQIVVYGRSLGTGIATCVASHHHPKLLVLEAPYFSLIDLTPRHLPYLPRFLVPLILKYHLRTDKWLAQVKSPVYIFHGTADELIPYDSSTRLMELVNHKIDIHVIPIENGKHNHLRKHPRYQLELDALLK